MGIGVLIGKVLKSFGEKRRRKRIESSFDEHGLSDEEREQLAPKKERAIENGGTGKVIGFLVLVGIGVPVSLLGLWLLVEGGPAILWGLALLFGGTLLYPAYSNYGDMQEGRELERELTENPEQFIRN